MKLLPYVFVNGSYTLSDSDMIGIFKLMQMHDLDKAVFPSGEMPDAGQFLRFMQNRKNIVHTIWDEHRLSMIAWVNGFGSNCAFAHFCCFPHTFGKTSVNLGKKCLEYWFGFKHDNGENVLDVIMGKIPSLNEIAIRYAQKCGMTELGRVPGIKYGGTVYDTSFLYVTRKDFYNGWKRR